MTHHLAEEELAHGGRALVRAFPPSTPAAGIRGRACARTALVGTVSTSRILPGGKIAPTVSLVHDTASFTATPTSASAYLPSVFDAPDALGTLKAPGALGAPAAPETPGTPGTPGAPGAPGVPDGPGAEAEGSSAPHAGQEVVSGSQSCPQAGHLLSSDTVVGLKHIAFPFQYAASSSVALSCTASFDWADKRSTKRRTRWAQRSNTSRASSTG